MADAVILFAAALLVLGGGCGVAWMAARSRRARAVQRANRPRVLSDDLRRTDDFIRDLGQAATDDELDRLAREYNEGGK